MNNVLLYKAPSLYSRSTVPNSEKQNSRQARRRHASRFIRRAGPQYPIYIQYREEDEWASTRSCCIHVAVHVWLLAATPPPLTTP